MTVETTSSQGNLGKHKSVTDMCDELIEHLEDVQQNIESGVEGLAKEAFVLGYKACASNVKHGEPTTKEWLEAKVILGLE